MLCDIIFMCVPEAIIEQVFYQAQVYGYPHKNFVLKSTVPVGTTRRLREKYGLVNLVHSPEFLTARCAVADACLPSRNIVGFPYGYPPYGDGGDPDQLHELHPVVNLYIKRFPGVPCLVMRSDESEMVKLVLNGFFAVKVAYWNEVRRLGDSYHVNWSNVMSGVLSDGRLTPDHTRVPGPDGKRGFGGTCLPKDLRQLIDCIEEAGQSAPVCRAAMNRNKIDRGE
jgi:UDPglucose 6-dehydrogenase